MNVSNFQEPKSPSLGQNKTAHCASWVHSAEYIIYFVLSKYNDIAKLLTM